MATTAELVWRIHDTIKDDSYTAEQIMALINQRVLLVAGGVLLPGTVRTSPPLPDLFVHNGELYAYPVTTGRVSMPTDYQRNCCHVADRTNGWEIDLALNFKEYQQYDPLLDETGSQIYLTAMKGSYLYYTPIAEISVTSGTGLAFVSSTKTITDTEEDLGDLEAGDLIYVSGSSDNDATLTVATVDSDGAYITVSEDITDEDAGEEITITRGERLLVHYYRKPTDRSLTVYHRDATTISFEASSKKISDSASGFDGVEEDDEICVLGAVSNSGHYTVASVDESNGYVVVNESLVDEDAGAAITIAVGNDEPDGLPSHLQIPLVVNGCAFDYFDLIEDGVEGQKVNTTRHENLFNKALLELDAFVPMDGDSMFVD